MNLHHILFISPIIAFIIICYLIIKLVLPVLEELRSNLELINTLQVDKINDTQHIVANLHQSLHQLKKAYANHVLLQQEEFAIQKARLAKRKLAIEAKEKAIYKERELYIRHQARLNQILEITKKGLKIY